MTHEVIISKWKLCIIRAHKTQQNEKHWLHYLSSKWDEKHDLLETAQTISALLNLLEFVDKWGSHILD